MDFISGSNQDVIMQNLRKKYLFCRRNCSFPMSSSCVTIFHASAAVCKPFASADWKYYDNNCLQWQLFLLLSEARVLISNFSLIYCLISSSTCHHKSNAGLFLRDVSFNGVTIEPIRKLKPKNGNFRRVSETISVLKLSHVRPISCGTVMFLMSACLLHAGQQLVLNQLLQIGLNIRKKSTLIK